MKGALLIGVVILISLVIYGWSRDSKNDGLVDNQVAACRRGVILIDALIRRDPTMEAVKKILYPVPCLELIQRP